MIRTDIGEVTPPSTRDANLLRWFSAFFEDQRVTPTRSRSGAAEQSRSASSKYQAINSFQRFVPRQLNRGGNTLVPPLWRHLKPM